VICKKLKEKTTDEIFSLFEEITGNYKRKNQYFDILYDSNSSTIIKKTRSEENITVNAKKSGIVARTFDDTWKEIAIQNWSDLSKIKKKLPTVTNKGEQLKKYPGWTLNEEITPKIDPREIPIEEKLEKIRNVYNEMGKFDDRIVNPAILYNEYIIERIFFNNEGCQLRQLIPRIRIFLQPFAKEGRNVDFDYFVTGGELGFEVFKNVEENISNACQNSIDMLKAEFPPSGNYPTILDPNMAGLIAHESFGHGLEADQIIRDRSYLKERLNKRVASDICTICDDPSIPKELGSYLFDEEGIKTKNNTLVKDGILTDFLYDRRTASVLDKQPKGNGRRQSFAHPVHVRMSNTYFEPGDYSLEEMISEIDEGVIVLKGYFGMEDPLGGGMQATSKKGYLIENGEKTKLLKSVALSGSVLDLLQNIDAVSQDEMSLYGGTCGKGSEDYVPVTSGGSYIRVKKALISPG
jgi:TldD protein